MNAVIGIADAFADFLILFAALSAQVPLIVGVGTLLNKICPWGDSP